MRDGAEPTVRELERGTVVFAYRPRVEGQPGIQRFFVLLGADADEPSAWRRIVIGKKLLPPPASRTRAWAYVERVGDSMDELFADLGPETYRTKTLGERHQPGAEVLAEGTYRIVAHGTHVHLAYELSGEALTDESEEHRALRDALGVCDRGSVVCAVFNPLAAWSRQATLSYGGDPGPREPFAEPSIFPDELQARFQDRRFTPLAPELLAFEGAELVVMGAQDRLPGEAA